MVNAINPAQFDQRITIQVGSQSKGPSGQALTTYADLCQAWAKVEENGAGEQQQGNGLNGVRNITVTLRYIDNITMRNRILHDGRTLDITGVTAVGRKQYLEISAVMREK